MVFTITFKSGRDCGWGHIKLAGVNGFRGGFILCYWVSFWLVDALFCVLSCCWTLFCCFAPHSCVSIAINKFIEKKTKKGWSVLWFFFSGLVNLRKTISIINLLDMKYICHFNAIYTYLSKINHVLNFLNIKLFMWRRSRLHNFFLLLL